MFEFLCIAVICLIYNAFAGAVLGDLLRNQRVAGFWLGAFLGPFGWLLVPALADKRVARPTGSRSQVYSSAAAAPPPEDHTCIPCGQEAVATVEMGRQVWHCPKCGRSV